MSKLDIPKAHLLGVKSSSGGHFDGQNFLKGFPKILPSAKERKVTLMHFEGVLLARGTDINQGSAFSLEAHLFKPDDPKEIA